MQTLLNIIGIVSAAKCAVIQGTNYVYGLNLSYKKMAFKVFKGKKITINN